MFVAYGGNTQRGIQARKAAIINEEKARRLSAQRALHMAKLAEAERVAAARRKEAERAEAIAAEMKAQGYEIRFRHTYAEIERRACKLFGVTKADIRSNRRDRRISFVRQFIMYWSSRTTRLSLPVIGRLMGGKDHTTVIHGRKAYVEKRAYMGRNLRRPS